MPLIHQHMDFILKVLHFELFQVHSQAEVQTPLRLHGACPSTRTFLSENELGKAPPCTTQDLPRSLWTETEMAGAPVA